jgi:hypothetical protein
VSCAAKRADIPIYYVTTLCNRDRRPHWPAGIEDLARGVGALIVAGGAANTYSIYDMFGRQLFVAFSAKF